MTPEAPTASPAPLVPTTGRERVQQALQVTEWMLRIIDAPKDLRYWPRKDQKAWLEVVGRPRIKVVMDTLRQRQEETDAPHEAGLDEATGG